MKKEHKNTLEATSLREKAEEKLAEKNAMQPPFLAEGDVVRLIHELEVHQVELEMQNEELRVAIDNAEVATEKFTMLYDFAPTGYFTLDHDSRIKELNLNGAKMLGRERNSLINMNFKSFISQNTRDVFREFYRKVFETGLKQTCEVRLTIQEVPSSYVHLEGIISESKQNCLIIAIDITERRRIEEALKENEIRLQELNATKDKFFSIIAHDLRGPFTSIIGFSGLLIDQVQMKNYEGIERYAEFIQESSYRAMNLLKNLLEWARLQTGRIKFNPKNIEILEIVNEVTELFKGHAQQKSITLSNEFQEDVNVFADKEMISNVLRNLVLNALKFTNPGGMITILAKQKQEELLMIVSDNGIGIEKDKVEKLFLIEGNQSTRGTQNEEGTGLGLILCKEFVLKHGGKIWVESEPGKGSRFYFTIPKK